MKLVVQETFYNRYKDELLRMIPNEEDIIIYDDDRFATNNITTERYFILTDWQIRDLQERGLL